MLKVFGINSNSLKDFKSGNTKHRFDNEPDENLRLKDREVSGQEDGGFIEQNPDEFNFVGRASLSVKKKNPAISVERASAQNQDVLDPDDLSDEELDQFGSMQDKFESNETSDNRRLTTDEMNEINGARGASLMKKNKRFTDTIDDDVAFEDFKMIMVLGRGTFGKVFLAELPKKGS